MMFLVVLVNVLLTGCVHNVPIIEKFTSGLQSSVQANESSFSQASTSITEGMESSFQAESLTSASSSLASESDSYKQVLSSPLSAFDYSHYSKIFEKCNFLDDTQKEVYLNMLSGYSPEKLVYIEKMMKYMNTGSPCLENDITDFNLAQSNIQAANEILKSKDIFDSNCDLASKQAILEEAKIKIKSAMEGLQPNSPLHEALKYATEKDIDMLPMVCDLNDIIFREQASYFSSVSKSISQAGSSVSQVKSINLGDACAC